MAAAADPQRLRQIWRELAEQGLAARGTDPSEDGLREVLLVMEELGRASCPAPLLSAALLNLAQLPAEYLCRLVQFAPGQKVIRANARLSSKQNATLH